MAFPGVAIVLDDADPVTGGQPADPNHLAYRSLGSPVTFTAGDSFMASFVATGADYPILNLAGPGDSIDAFVTFEHTGGSAQVRLSWGWNLDYDAGSPADATTSAGTATVVGAGVTPVQLPGFDFQRFYDSDESLVVFVEVLSGALEVAQLRLRVWPTAGVVGSWASADGFTVDLFTSPAVTLMEPPDGSYMSEVYTADNAPDAHAQAAAALVADNSYPAVNGFWTGADAGFIRGRERVEVGWVDTSTNGSFYVRNSSAAAIPVNVYDAGRDLINTLVVAGFPDPLPGSAIRPPDQVNDGGELYGQILTGTPTVSQARLTGKWSSSSGAAEMAWSVVTRAAFDAGPVPFPGGSLAMPSGIHVPIDEPFPITGLTGDGHVLLIGARANFDPNPYDGPPFIGILGGWSKEGEAQYSYHEFDEGLHFTLVVPAFRYWDAAAPPEPPPLRQIQRDDAANGFSAARWGGGSSRGASNRWVGYV